MEKNKLIKDQINQYARKTINYETKMEEARNPKISSDENNVMYR